ncbi:MAG: hypothetical protein HY562_03295 [Ignavibacteriales bacterium]|nr:hypothetical protein [Ignavibacteriales bacterium]
MRKSKYLVRLGLCAAFTISWWHTSPISASIPPGCFHHKFIVQQDFTLLLAIQPGKGSEQKPPNKSFEGIEITEQAEQQFSSTIDSHFEAAVSYSSEILFTLTTSSFL